jgi:hypothetical protein
MDLSLSARPYTGVAYLFTVNTHRRQRLLTDSELLRALREASRLVVAEPRQTAFIAFVDRLRGITPDPTTTSYSVDLAVSCDEPVVCTADVKICPDGSGVPRVPPTCEFAACPGE